MKTGMWAFFSVAVLVPACWIVLHEAGIFLKPGQAKVTFPDGTRLDCEVADSDEERRVGLSDHVWLDQDRGMLFLLDEPGRPSFWMKDMNFPIDIIWISGETVVGIASNVPVPTPGVGSDDVPEYQSEIPIDRVLEVNAGFAAAHGLEVGDRLDMDLP